MEESLSVLLHFDFLNDSSDWLQTSRLHLGWAVLEKASTLPLYILLDVKQKAEIHYEGSAGPKEVRWHMWSCLDDALKRAENWINADQAISAYWKAHFEGALH